MQVRMKVMYPKEDLLAISPVLRCLPRNYLPKASRRKKVVFTVKFFFRRERDLFSGQISLFMSKLPMRTGSARLFIDSGATYGARNLEKLLELWRNVGEKRGPLVNLSN